MRETYNLYEPKVRETFGQIRNFINYFMLFLCLASFAYLLFWTGAVNDDYILEAGAKIFNPLASVFFGEEITVATYQNVSVILFCAIFPTIFVQYLCNKIEEHLILNHKKVEKMNEEIKQRKEIIKFQSRYDGIRMYSICLSVDYKGKENISNESKQKLNSVVFAKIKNQLKVIEPKSFVSFSDVLIFSSDNFSNYDMVYDLILKMLANSKGEIEKKYNLILTPSITTDAYQESFKLNDIRKNHFEIQSFNFKNRSLSSATFAKKYKHLKQNKYAGVPIGEYAYFEDNSSKTYELNVIHKNLELQLNKAI